MSLNVFKRSICVEALMQLKISTRIWQKSQCRKMADSCAVRCLLVHCFTFGSCFCTWYLQLFLKLLQRIIIHFMKWIYFTHPTGHWFTYFSGNILLLSELCSLLQGCIHWDVKLPGPWFYCMIYWCMGWLFSTIPVKTLGSPSSLGGGNNPSFPVFCWQWALM